MSLARSLASVAFLSSTTLLASAQRSALIDLRAADAAFDHARGHVYLSSRELEKVVRVDRNSGAVTREWIFEYPAESLAITPDGRWLYVALLTQPHGYYDSGDHTGRIAEIDLATGELVREFAINEDPWDIVATDARFLVVSSGSGQWDEIRSYDLETMANVGTSFIRHRSNLTLHPSQTRVYAADTDLSPSDIERFDLDPVTGALTARGDSPYHGDHPMQGEVHAHPSGGLLVTRGGGVYTSTDDPAGDMRFVRTLEHGLLEHVAFDTAFQGLLSAGSSTIDYYNLVSLESVQRLPFGSSPDFLSVSGEWLYVVDVLATQTRLTGVRSPSSFSAGNTPPAAAFAASVDPLLEPRYTLKLDASAASDAEDHPEELVFRWDLDGDGAFDTPFSPERLLDQVYPVAGTKTITLEVKDRFGLVDRDVQDVDVLLVPEPAPPFVAQPMFEVQFPAADVLFDPSRPHVYLTSLERGELVQVHRWTGLVTNRWTFAHPAESLTMTPDARWLYVALLTPGHDYYGFDDHTGKIAEIDLVLGVPTRVFDINEDPWDLVATDSGFLVVSSGSGQWDEIRSYDLATTANVGTALIRHFSELALHPSQTRVYAANTDLSPADVERFDLDPVTGALVRRGDSPYHGHHPIGADVWALPGGAHLVTGGGAVLTSTDAFATDMRHVLDLAGGAVALAVSPDGATFVRSHYAYFTPPRLSLHRTSDLAELRQIPLPPGNVRFVRHEANRILYASIDAQRTLFGQVRLLEISRP